MYTNLGEGIFRDGDNNHYVVDNRTLVVPADGQPIRMYWLAVNEQFDLCPNNGLLLTPEMIDKIKKIKVLEASPFRF